MSRGAAALLLGVIIAGAFWFAQFAEHRHTERNVAGHPGGDKLEEVAHRFERDKITKIISRGPWLLPKVLIIDGSTGHVDKLHYSLPEELRAARPEEVRTVVWVERGEAVVGHYGSESGGAARQFGCSFVIADISVPYRFKPTDVLWGSPPPNTGPSQGASGSDPNPQIIPYLLSLSRGPKTWEDYLALFGSPVMFEGPEPNHLRPKVFTFRVSSVPLDLPPELRAEKVEDVHTVMLLDREKDGTVDIVLGDMDVLKWTGHHRIRSYSTDALNQYLEGLPRR